MKALNLLIDPRKYFFNRRQITRSVNSAMNALADISVMGVIDFSPTLTNKNPTPQKIDITKSMTKFRIIVVIMKYNK